MRKKIQEKIEIPAGWKIEVDGNMVKGEKNGVAVEKKIPYSAKVEGNQVVIEKEKATKRDKKLIKTSAAHIRNLFSGLEKKFVYKLQVCSVHFPMNVEVKGNEIIIKNFLGEVKERKARILEGVEAKVEKDIITLQGHDKDKTGQAAANIENATRIRARDRRVFQDGIFIISKEKGARR